MSSKPNSEPTIELSAVETAEKVGIIISLLSDSLRRYGRLTIELPTRSILACQFESAKRKATFAVPISEINGYRKNELIDLVHILINRHLHDFLQSIEFESLPELGGSRISPADP